MIIRSLADLGTILPDADTAGAGFSPRRAIRGVSTDSRSLKKGELFVPLAGESFDGHDFLSVAQARGAAAALVSRRWLEGGGEKGGGDFPLLVVDDTLEAYGRIATAHRAEFRYPVIAVAGSNGKTTTKDLLTALLATRYNVLATEGNLNNLIGVPATILRMTDEHTAAVIEIGTNAPGEIARLCQILRPTHGVITNIGREHLELLGSLDGVAREEGKLFEYLKENNGVAYVNIDDPYLKAMGRGLPHAVRYGRGRTADIGARVGRLDQSGAPALTIIDRRAAEPKEIALQLGTPGIHTATNAVAAAAIALTLKVSPTRVKKALSEFTPRSYRAGYARLLAMVAANGARVLNDTYNSNPDSVRAALVTLAAMKPGKGGRRIAVLGDMKELGASSAEEHRRIGREAAGDRRIDIVIFHGEEMRLAHEAARQVKDARAESLFFARKDELSDAVAAMLKSEDILLVKGSRGMKMEDVVRRVEGETGGTGGRAGRREKR